MAAILGFFFGGLPEETCYSEGCNCHACWHFMLCSQLGACHPLFVHIVMLVASWLPPFFPSKNMLLAPVVCTTTNTCSFFLRPHVPTPFLNNAYWATFIHLYFKLSWLHFLMYYGIAIVVVLLAYIIHMKNHFYCWQHACCHSPQPRTSD